MEFVKMPPPFDWLVATNDPCVVQVDGVKVSRELFCAFADAANEGQVFRLVKAAGADGIVTVERQYFVDKERGA